MDPSSLESICESSSKQIMTQLVENPWNDNNNVPIFATHLAPFVENSLVRFDELNVIQTLVSNLLSNTNTQPVIIDSISTQLQTVFTIIDVLEAQTNDLKNIFSDIESRVLHIEKIYRKKSVRNTAHSFTNSFRRWRSRNVHLDNFNDAKDNVDFVTNSLGKPPPALPLFSSEKFLKQLESKTLLRSKSKKNKIEE